MTMQTLKVDDGHATAAPAADSGCSCCGEECGDDCCEGDDCCTTSAVIQPPAVSA